MQVSRKELRQFLAARDMSLAVFFDRRYHAGHIIEVSEEKRKSSLRRDLFVYRFDAFHHRRLNNGKPETYSRLLGKKVIGGLPREKCGIWPYNEEPIGELGKFKIGVDDNEDDILAYSSPYSYGAASTDLNLPDGYHIPDYCTFVFFERGLLDKYFNEPSRFKVEDGLLRCGTTWVLQIDNNNPDYVIALLGDLGRDLPHTEHKHWQQHNVAPHGGMSESHFRSQFPSTVEEALDPGEPEDSSLLFKRKFPRFVDTWHQKHSWHLFKPLKDADAHHCTKLRRPLNKELTEFHEIMLSLSVIMQDRIDKTELGKHIPDFEPKNADKAKKGNIPVLGEYLESQGFPDSEHYVEYLRMLQVLRSNCGKVHPRNEKACQKAERFFSLDSKSTTQVADDIFTTLTEFLDSLREHFCPDDTD